MKHLHAAGLELSPDFAARLGKKASEADFSTYSRKQGDEVLCVYHPAKYPGKIQPLLYCLSLCDVAYIRPEAIGKTAGEMLVAAAHFPAKLIVVADLVGKEELEPIVKSAGISSYEFFEQDASLLCQKLLSEKSRRDPAGRTEIVIDSCFPVKGVGTVALGIVQKGKVFLRQKLFICPSGLQTEVKSIQVQDQSVDEAGAGSRVGMSLKGIEPSQIERGDLACDSPIEACGKFQADVFASPFYKGQMDRGQLFLLAGLKTAACKVRKIAGDRHEIEIQPRLCLRENEEACLFSPDCMPRVVGKAKVLSVG
ncbi:MAG: EF-Tu/IF-2/RF-3 family GTPase [Candidatus Micrarchaeota archaeon]|nr:EF-Tu/IF-2/RF-3 family GTPase [Candidatus Micrarchaeota archaeon]